MIDPRTRTGFLGASEVPAILDLSPFASQYDVWQSKIAPQAPSPNTDAQSLGNIIEPALIARYGREHPDVTPNHVTWKHPSAPLGATPDGFVGSEGIVEAKWVLGMEQHWREGPPEYVVVQALIQLAVTGRAWCDIISCVGGEFRPRTRIMRDVELEQELVAASAAWWDAHVLGGKPPPMSTKERIHYLASLHPPKSEVRLTEGDEAWAAFLADRAVLSAKIAELEEERRALDAAVLEVMPAAVVRGRFGSVQVLEVRGKVDWKALAIHLAGGEVGQDLADTFRRPAHRELRVYPRKGG